TQSFVAARPTFQSCHCFPFPPPAFYWWKSLAKRHRHRIPAIARGCWLGQRLQDVRQIAAGDARVGDSHVQQSPVAPCLNGDLATLRFDLETVLDCVRDNRLEKQGRNRRGQRVRSDLEVVLDAVVKAEMHYREILFNKLTSRS